MERSGTLGKHKRWPALKERQTPLSAIIMKLLAKTAEERYQTAGGVERDLRHCLAEWEARGGIDDLSLGQQDAPTGC